MFEKIAVILIFLFFIAYAIYFLIDMKNRSILYKKVSKKDISKADNFFELSVMKENEGDTKGAYVALNKAISINPTCAEYYLSRGIINKKMSKFHDALSDFSTAISINSSLIDAYENRKATYLELDEFRNALRDAQRIIVLDSENPLRYLHYVDIKFALNEKTGVVTYLNKAFELANAQNNTRLFKEISEKLKQIN